MTTLKFIKAALKTDDKDPGMWQARSSKSFDDTSLLCAAANLGLVAIAPSNEAFKVLRENAKRYVNSKD